MGFIVKEKLPSVQMVRDLTPSFGTWLFWDIMHQETMQFLQLQLQNVGFCGCRNETGF